MTSVVESSHQQRQQYGGAANRDNQSQSPSVSGPRFEAFVMTGNHILPSGRVSKTNIHSTSASSPVSEKKNGRRSVNPSPTNNIVLHSPVLGAASRISTSPQEKEKEKEEEEDGILQRSCARNDDEHELLFQYRTHDEHQFYLTGPGYHIPHHTAHSDEAEAKSENQVSSLAPTLDLLESSAKNRGSEAVSAGQRPFTPEIVDNRPVWTVNAPVEALAFHSDGLLVSPERRRSSRGSRFREILREETTIIDTTISEVTDTNIVTSYILNSPRTPRHLAKDIEINSLHPAEDHPTKPEEYNEPEPTLSSAMVINVDGDQPWDDVAKEDSRINIVTNFPVFLHPASARETMEIFSLQDLSLDQALRHFLTNVKLVGETEARQRVVDLFVLRYIECNPKTIYTRESANAVVSALLILNSDLYSQHRPFRPRDLEGFLQGLREIPACAALPDEDLRLLFLSVKKEQLPVAGKAEDGEFYRPCDTVDDKGAICKSGFLFRKSCCEVGGVDTRWGRRGWKRVFVVLTQMALECFKNEPVNDSDATAINSVPLHHGYVTPAKDYRKRPLVFRLRAIDESMALFRAVNEDEFVSWLHAINHTAASNSATVSLPVGSQTMSKKRQPNTNIRPLYASRKSGLSLVEQVEELKINEARLIHEIQTLNTEEPASRRELLEMSAQLDFFNRELERTKIYLVALGGK
ncbi:putative PH and SEC7 domain-containing protein 3 [Hypsibius exemplaris]|uniref:PH and SEC7 domain-containing protein 3 n=1 Tax=Hypsibius exemplaris TaxID=2072580 RepID=A0A1W0WJX9_HYPEX|nr:putative PH and SEC7 domain-containing protein 3 [Hypsibius exemplaris]